MMPISTPSPDFSAITTQASQSRVPALDGLRGLAVLMVLVFHFVGIVPPTNGVESLIFGIAKYGAYGVDLFFVLSGFLITGILYDTSGTPNAFRNFFMRRVLRIFPLYYAVLIAVFVVAPRIPLFHGPTLDTLVEKQAWAWLYGVNLYIAREGAWSFSYLQHFWSLAVEEHFYLFWPFVVFSLVHRPRLLAIVCLCLATVAFGARFFAVTFGMSSVSAYVFTPLRLDGLALGAWLAVVLRHPGGCETLSRYVVPIAAAAGLAMVACFALPRLTGQSGSAAVAVLKSGLVQALLGCALVVVVTGDANSHVNRLISHPVLIWFGTYSYGLYVYHHFFSYAAEQHQTVTSLATSMGSHTAAVAVQAVIGIALSCLIAYLSYEFFEKRFLALKRHFEPVQSGSHVPPSTAPPLTR